ncbi:Galactose mutarotase-like protein [Mycena venus]|uniref:Galactose mutarotase-like protein n=1 Tax=Mycena venus TaxID=2733690 RepID=A0A8H6YQY8_9AGAR|nr:Galactose mutarotase-like protein [Mycena venus]
MWVLLVLISLYQAAVAASVDEFSTLYRFANDHISFDVVKTTGYIHNLTYAGVGLLGTVSGNAGQLYSDFPSAVFSITGNASAKIVRGGAWAGIVLTDNNTTVGTLVQRSWFLRDGESGLHSFLRLGYHNATGPSLGALGESRTMFRPNGGPWTHIVTNGEQWAPQPSAEALAQEVAVQDATWYLGLTPDDAYVIEESDYWTKYTFADNQTNKAHGLFGNTSDRNTFGAWWVVNQKDTFFGGPLHIDLMVDGIAYNKQSTNHGGATSPNITNGFDRTFGPQFLYFNHGQGASLHDLLADAEALADPSWNSAFYDEIAPYVVGYAPSAVRGSFSTHVHLPHGAEEPMAVLSTNGVHFQDNAFDPTAYQYWGSIVPVPGTDLGQVSIPRVKAGTYRLTVFAAGIFGDFVQDNVIVRAGENTDVEIVWTPESAGRELWRLGVPDKSSGEFRNGNERDESHPLRPAKYRIYWGAWDFPTQFPQGVNFTIGVSREGVDWNYIHWSQYGPTYIDNRTITDFNNWQINFNLAEAPSAASVATFTIQLAAAKTTAGNTDDNTGADPSFPISTYVNDEAAPLTWVIQAFESSSCGQRSAISCHLLSRKFEFPGNWLKRGSNKFVISLPFNAPVYIQYDALRLELRE